MGYLIISGVVFFIAWKASKVHSLAKEVRNAKFITELVSQILQDEEIRFVEVLDRKKQKRERMEDERDLLREMRRAAQNDY